MIEHNRAFFEHKYFMQYYMIENGKIQKRRMVDKVRKRIIREIAPSPPSNEFKGIEVYQDDEKDKKDTKKVLHRPRKK